MSRKYFLAGCVIAAGITFAGASYGIAGASPRAQAKPAAAQTSGLPKVYHGTAEGISIHLGAAPATIVTTPSLPTGTYLVDYAVGISLGASAGVVCAAGITSAGPSNDGLFGGAGNGSTSSGVYGTATMTDTFKVTTANSTISVWCTDAARDSHATLASVTALKVA